MSCLMGEFIIPVHISDETDLYTQFDPSGLAFSSDLTEYLSDYVEDRKPGETICVEIRSDTQPDLERIRQAFHLFIEKLTRRNRRETRRNRANSIRLLLIGIFFIVIGILSAHHINSVVAAIISTIGSFSIWEASSIWIEILPALRKRERQLKMFADAKIRYIEQD